MRDLTVETTAGKVRGLRSPNGPFAFLGIPYGESTEGARRFQAPQPKASWDGIRDCLAYGPSCRQLDQNTDHQSAVTIRRDATASLNESEDSLHLNVWSPDLDPGEKRPVMVWFHGAGFYGKSGSLADPGGAVLATRGDVVVVSVTHRLNAFGYLHLADIDDQYPDASVAGMLDLVLALEWVRDNIAAFGGDPGNVTIFGCSGGGAKVSVALAMPAAQGLFHKASIQSGSRVRLTEPGDATKLTKAILDHLAIKPGELSRLQELPVAPLLEEIGNVRGVEEPHRLGRRPRANLVRLGPVPGSTHLPRHPFHPDAPDTAAGIPLLIGVSRDESITYLARDPRSAALRGLDDAGLVDHLRDDLGDRAGAIVGAYRAGYPETTPFELGLRITSEDRRIQATPLADRKAADSDAPVYFWRLEYESDNFPVPAAAHAADVPLIFGEIDCDTLGRRPDRAQMSEVMGRTWAAFAHTGNPNNPTLPQWPAYTTDERTTMVLDLPSTAVPAFRQELLDVWVGVPV